VNSMPSVLHAAVPCGRASSRGRLELRERMGIAALCAAGILVLGVYWHQGFPKIFSGHNDFIMLYAGARAGGGPLTYDSERFQQLEREASGLTPSGAMLYPRPPYYAVLTRPLALFPYPTAYRIWQALSMAAVVLFVLVLPGEPWVTALAVCWSYPASYGLASGQDVSFVALWVAVALRLRQKRPFWSGAVLALCAPKFHLFVCLPLLLYRRAARRMATGLLTAGGVLIVLSFAAGGAGWVQRYARTVMDPRIQLSPEIMPNLHGLLAGVPGQAAWEVVLTAAVVALVWFIARNSDFEIGFAGVLLGGLLVSYHAYACDFLLTIPALLTIQRLTQSWPSLISVAMLFPLSYWLYPQIGFLAVLGALAWHVRSTRVAAPGAFTAPAARPG